MDIRKSLAIISVFVVAMVAADAFAQIFAPPPPPPPPGSGYQQMPQQVPRSSQGIALGNVCQTPIGWAFLPQPQPLGSVCWVPTPQGPVQGVTMVRY